MQKQLYTKNMVYGMTYRGDCVGKGKAVPLHSEIRDVHRLAADVDYFFRARMLSHVALRKIKIRTEQRPLPPALSRREGAGRQQRNIKENEQNYGQYKANANARILLLPGYDDGNEVRDCTYIV